MNSVTLMKNALFGAALFFGIFKMAVFIWAVPRGFDITDEGFLMNGYSHWKSYNTFDYYRFLNFFFSTAPLTVLDFRWIRIFLEMMSVILFTAGFSVWYNHWQVKEGKEKHPTGLFAAVAAIALFQNILYKTVGYNDFVYTIISINWFVLLMSEVYFSNQTRYQNVWWFLIYAVSGVFSASLVFLKPPSAIVEVFLLVIYTLSLRRVLSNVSYSVIFAGFLTGFASLFLLYIGGTEKIIAWAKNYMVLAEAYRNLEYRLGIVLGDFLVEIVHYLITFALATFTVWVIKHIYSFVLNRDINWPVTFLLHVGAVVLYARLAETVVGLHSYHYYLHYTILFFFLLIYHLPRLYKITGYKTAGMLIRNILQSHKLTAFVVFLLFHFAIVGGSVVSFSEMFYVFPLPFLLVFFVPAVSISRHSLSAKKVYLLLLLMLTLMAFNFCYFSIIHPWGIATPLTEQLVEQNFPKGLMVDEKTDVMLRGIKGILKEGSFEANGPIIGLDFLCGLIYLNEGFSPGTPCYPPGVGNKRKFNCYFMSTFNLDSTKEVPVIYAKNTSLESLKCLKQEKEVKEFIVMDSVENAYFKNVENRIILGENSEFVKVAKIKFR